MTDSDFSERLDYGSQFYESRDDDLLLPDDPEAAPEYPDLPDEPKSLDDKVSGFWYNPDS